MPVLLLLISCNCAGGFEWETKGFHFFFFNDSIVVNRCANVFCFRDYLRALVSSQASGCASYRSILSIFTK